MEKDGQRVKKLHSKLNLKPALSWHTKIIQLKDIPANHSVGYGCTYKTVKKTKLALIPVGYWEGYDRKLSNYGEVLVQEKKCKIRGRVCMNLTMIDVTHLTKVRVGETVTLLGTDGWQKISAEDMADKIRTINYEVITRINPNIPRIYH